MVVVFRCCPLVVPAAVLPLSPLAPSPLSLCMKHSFRPPARPLLCRPSTGAGQADRKYKWQILYWMFVIVYPPLQKTYFCEPMTYIKSLIYPLTKYLIQGKI